MNTGERSKWDEGTKWINIKKKKSDGLSCRDTIPH
jgi:hypothetical protein